MTTIEWTQRAGTKGETWNATVGCSLISPGCARCYAMHMAGRLEAMGQRDYAGLTKKTVGGITTWTGEVRTLPHRLSVPLNWRAPRTVFVDSMSDLHHETVPFDFVAAVYGVVAATRRHTYQLLTKRPVLRLGFFEWIAREAATRDNIIGGPRETIVAARTADRFLGRDCADLGLDVRVDPSNPTCFDGVPWPLPNLWQGVSVEDRKHGVPRIELLRQTPAAVRFLSIEPLLEDLGELDLRCIDQVIVGAESGRGARPMHDDWVRSIRDQCVAQNVAFFFKQRLNERGHKVSLPVLDGRQWAEFPRPA